MLAGICRDITERIERERALEASNERLERRGELQKRGDVRGYLR
jgi:hypothetical protein